MYSLPPPICPANRVRPQVKSIHVALGDISGVLKMHSESAQGSVALSFFKSLILDVFQLMLEQRCHEIDFMVKRFNRITRHYGDRERKRLKERNKVTLSR